VAAGEATMGEEVENDYSVVDPLLGNIEWDQPEPYNLMCPIYT